MTFAVICIVVLAGLAALWFSPLRLSLLRKLSCLHQYKFACRIECCIDESKPVNQDKVLCVQMIGRIPTACDDVDTDVCIEMRDVTGGLFRHDLVLSVDEKYRSSEHPGFWYVTHNGIIPKKDAILASWKTIAEVPSSQLRFAYRGRRKLQFKVSILSHQTGDVITSARQTIEYVSCLDGYKQLQNRKLAVLKASTKVIIGLCQTERSSHEKIKPLILQWLEKKTQTFPAAGSLAEWVQSLEIPDQQCDFRKDIECLLAYAQQTDKLAVVELVLKVFSVSVEMTAQQLSDLAWVADKLQIKQSRFRALCQKMLLFSDCTLHTPALLLGIDESMDEETFRSRLNEEYRKWNARVTHPDEEIRRQADRVLSLIAELRSARVMSEVS